MKIFKTIKSIHSNLSVIDKSKSLGFVPTMGALHAGHLSIIKKAKKDNDHVVVSIFVNPTQFDNKEDLIKYPSTLEKDLKLLKTVSCDFVFCPTANEIYDSKIKSESFDFSGLDQVMEGAFRKGHFDGVATVVEKFFEIINPDKAYFGEKDFQQLQIIKKMVAINRFPIQIIPCPIFREADGLAMSSRNVRLNIQQRNAAPIIHKILIKSKELFANKGVETIKYFVEKEFERNPFLALEYFEMVEINTLMPITKKMNKKKYRAFIAAFAGEVRLIDNIALN